MLTSPRSLQFPLPSAKRTSVIGLELSFHFRNRLVRRISRYFYDCNVLEECVAIVDVGIRLSGHCPSYDGNENSVNSVTKTNLVIKLNLLALWAE